MTPLASVILLIYLRIQNGVCTWAPTEAKNPNRQDVSWGHRELSAQHPKPWDESSILPSPKHSELEA